MKKITVFYENWIKKQKLNLLFLKIIDCYIKEWEGKVKLKR